MARRDSYFRARESRRCVKLQYGTCRVSSAWRRLLDEISLARMPATWPMVEECRSQFLHPTSESSRRNKRFKHIRSGIELSSTGWQLRDSSRYHPTFCNDSTYHPARCPLPTGHPSSFTTCQCSMLPAPALHTCISARFDSMPQQEIQRWQTPDGPREFHVGLPFAISRDANVQRSANRHVCSDLLTSLTDQG